MCELEDYVSNTENRAQISENTPLLRDLNAVENVALVLEYHKKIPIKKAEEIVFELFKRCNIDDIGYRRIYEIDRKDILILKFLRAYVSYFSEILIVKPFSMLDKMEDMDRLFELFNMLNDKMVIVADLKSNRYYEDRDVIQ